MVRVGVRLLGLTGFSSRTQSTDFSKIQIGRSKNTFIYLFSKTVFFKLVLDLIKEKPLSRFAYLEELALKAVVLQSELEADSDEPE